MKIYKTISLFLAAWMIMFSIAGCADNNGGAGGGANPPANGSGAAAGGASLPAEKASAPEDGASLPAEKAGPPTDGANPADEEISYEEGTSVSDNIVNTTAADKVLLVVSFGTSFNQSRHLTIGGIEAALREAYPDYQIRRAFTSQIIIDKLAKRDGLRVDNVDEAMSRLVLDKVKEVVIQPTTVMTGYEYNDMLDEATPYSDKFESFKIGKPLLVDDADYDKVAAQIVEETTQYRAADTAIVFMGHGTEHEAAMTYAKLQDVLVARGDKDYIIGTVEHGIELDEVRGMLAGMGVKKVALRPLMIVAGDHANNDMAGDEEDSWKTVLTEDGYEVTAIVEGLGQIKGIQELFIQHAREAIDSTDLSTTPSAEAAGIAAGRVKEGVYSLEVGSSASMFRIVDCQLTVAGGGMTAVITMSGQGYDKIYMGTVEQALADTGGNIHDYADQGDRHSFTIPVSALDRELDCAGLGAKSGKWFDHTVVFKTNTMPDEAFLPRQISVAMTGGSGKASIQSPTKLTYKDGSNYAEICWSSPNYTYMLVDGAEYLPISTEGGATFEIPAVLDKDMKVVACTTAMSTPREIEYVLHFDSASIQ